MTGVLTMKSVYLLVNDDRRYDVSFEAFSDHGLAHDRFQTLLRAYWNECGCDFNGDADESGRGYDEVLSSDYYSVDGFDLFIREIPLHSMTGGQ